MSVKTFHEINKTNQNDTNEKVVDMLSSFAVVVLLDRLENETCNLLWFVYQGCDLDGISIEAEVEASLLAVQQLTNFHFRRKKVVS